MPDYSPKTASSGRESTFGRGLVNYIASKLPYQNNNLIDNIGQLNPKFKYFYQTGTDRQEQLSRHAISTLSTTAADAPHGGMNVVNSYHNFMYANMEQDKSKRLRDYRVMSQFSEVSDAMDEICDDIINIDNDGDIIKLIITDRDFSDSVEKEIRQEYKKFIHYFDFENRGWEYFRHLLVDGELFFENIIPFFLYKIYL